MTDKRLSPKISVCGASNDKLEVWDRIASVLGSNTQATRFLTDILVREINQLVCQYH